MKTGKKMGKGDIFHGIQFIVPFVPFGMNERENASACFMYV